MAHHLRSLLLLVGVTLTTATDSAHAAQAGVSCAADSLREVTTEDLFLLQMGATRTLPHPRDEAEDEPSAGGGEEEKGRPLKSKVKRVQGIAKDLQKRVTKVEDIQADIQADAGSSLEDEGESEPYEEQDRQCNVDAESCTLLPHCEVDVKTLRCVPTGTASPHEGEARNCSVPDPAACQQKEGCEVAPNLMCVPKGTSSGSLLQKRKATSGSYHVTTLKSHPRCTPLYPDLQVHAGNHGDVCVTRHGELWSHSCPTGCAPIPHPAPAPYCLLAGTRESCHYKYSCPPRTLHTVLSNHDSDANIGNHCQGGGSHSWIAPDGCHAKWHAPYSVAPYTNNPCRVKEGTPKAPTAYWELIAAGTHGVTASMEVGVTSSNSQSVTKEQTHSFGVEITTGTSFGVPQVGMSFDVEVTASYEFSSMVGNTVESALEQSQVRTVEVECPDWFNSPTETRHPGNAKMEYIWQFVVSDGNLMAKTDYFRCHQTSGEPMMPECPPQLCGDPKDNEFCKLSLSSTCRRYLRYGR